MQLFRKLLPDPVSDKNFAFTFGNFDGVHLGHQAIFNRVITYAKEHNLASCILTFHNQPLEILQPNKPVPTRLTTPEQKLKLIELFGFDVVLDIDFTEEFAEQTADKFLQNVRQMVPFTFIAVGPDVAFGKGRKGNKEFLMKKSKQDFQVEIVDKFQVGETVVSSSLIRKLIANGELIRAATYLGRPYTLQAKVIPGDGLGRQLGFPTINLDVHDLTIPPIGIYSAEVMLENETAWRKATAYLGTGPTLQQRLKAVLEIHLLDCPKDISAEKMDVRLNEFLREDRVFSSKEELIAQIKKDISSIS